MKRTLLVLAIVLNIPYLSHAFNEAPYDGIDGGQSFSTFWDHDRDTGIKSSVGWLDFDAPMEFSSTQGRIPSEEVVGELNNLSYFFQMLTTYTDPKTGSMDSLFLEAIRQVEQKEDVTSKVLLPIVEKLLARDKLLIPHMASIVGNPKFTGQLNASIEKFLNPDYPDFYQQFQENLGKSL